MQRDMKYVFMPHVDAKLKRYEDFLCINIINVFVANYDLQNCFAKPIFIDPIYYNLDVIICKMGWQLTKHLPCKVMCDVFEK